MQAELASALGLHYLCGKIRIMARKKANYPLIEGLEITTLAAEGKAMGRWNDVVVFVPLTVGGGIRTIEDLVTYINLGCDRIGASAAVGLLRNRLEEDLCE